MTTVFVDLRSAFYSMDREVLTRKLRERRIREGLVEKAEEVLREVRSSVRVGDGLGKGFWTTRRVRQGCPANPVLFNIVMDLEEEMNKVKWGRLRLEEKRMYSLQYADDVC